MEQATGGGTKPGGQASPPVFISYARGASQEQARALHAELSGKDERAFLDESDIEVGGRYPLMLVDALLASRVIVIFTSEEYFRRWYCLWELDAVLGPYLGMWEGAEEPEKEAALAPVIIALPAEGVVVPELTPLPPLLQKSNWPRAGDTARLARQVRERLAAGYGTLGERLDAAGQVGARFRSRLLEGKAVRPPSSLAGVRCFPRELPPSLGTSFVGREDDLWRIHHTLSVLQDMRGEGATGAGLAAAVIGGGGFGKTRLVLEYLHRFGPSHYPGGLFWVNADVAEDRLEKQFHGILRTLKPQVPDLVTFRKSGRNASEELARALDKAATEGRILYVVDNVPEVGPGDVPELLTKWCPALGKVSLLVTSRGCMGVGTEGVQELPLATLPPDAAVALLTDGIGWKGLSESDWRQIAEWVGFLPLALELLNRAMRAGVRPEGLLARARDQGPVQGLEAQMKLLRRHVPAGALRGITEAFSISYDRLSEEERVAARLLAWLAPEAIPWKLLEAIGPEVSSEEVYTTLRSRHFVTAVGNEEVSMFGSMHRVLADYLRSQSSEPQRELRQVCQGLIQVMEPTALEDPTTWPLMDACRPHAEGVFGRLTKDEATSDVRGEIALGLRLSLFQYAKGPAKQAQSFAERIVERAAEKLGTEDPDTLTAMLTLARTLRAQGELDRAHVYQEQVLEVSRRVLGEEDPDTLKAMGNLAGTLRAQGELGGARVYQERVLEVRKRVLGEEHPATLRAMNNLAQTLREQGDLGGARVYQERVVEVSMQVLGEEHLDTLRAMGNLAGTLREQGDLGGARRYQERVVEVRKRVLGEEHPATLNAMGKLAQTLSAQGELGGARVYQERVVEVSKRVQGEEHPATLKAMGNLAQTLCAQGELGAARVYQERVLEVRGRVLGEEHPATLTAMNNLAWTLCAQGELGAARVYQERVLEVSQRVLGEEHPETLTAMNNLARTLFEQGELLGARRHEERVVEVRKRVLGEEHPATLVAKLNLEMILDMQRAHLGTGEVSRRVQGEEHSATLAAMGNLTATLSEQGGLGGARGYQERVLEVSKRVLGEEHPATLTAMNNLAMTLFEQGELVGARRYEERVLEVRRRVLGEEHPDTLTAKRNLEMILHKQ